jgi:hypothetical protein
MPASHSSKRARDGKSASDAKPMLAEIDWTEQTSRIIKVDGR